jgi:hypothetical protein
MPYAFVQDIPASWEHYDSLGAALADPVPAGLILHLAGATDEGFRTIDLWETRESWARFRDEQLALLSVALPSLTSAAVTLRELRTLNIVLDTRTIDLDRRHQ